MSTQSPPAEDLPQTSGLPLAPARPGAWAPADACGPSAAGDVCALEGAAANPSVGAAAEAKRCEDAHSHPSSLAADARGEPAASLPPRDVYPARRAARPTRAAQPRTTAWRKRGDQEPNDRAPEAGQTNQTSQTSPPRAEGMPGAGLGQTANLANPANQTPPKDLLSVRLAQIPLERLHTPHPAILERDTRLDRLAVHQGALNDLAAQSVDILLIHFAPWVIEHVTRKAHTYQVVWGLEVVNWLRSTLKADQRIPVYVLQGEPSNRQVLKIAASCAAAAVSRGQQILPSDALCLAVDAEREGAPVLRQTLCDESFGNSKRMSDDPAQAYAQALGLGRGVVGEEAARPSLILGKRAEAHGSRPWQRSGRGVAKGVANGVAKGAAQGGTKEGTNEGTNEGRKEGRKEGTKSAPTGAPTSTPTGARTDGARTGRTGRSS